MIELGLHTDNWRTLSGSFETACDAAVKYGLGHIEFAVIHECGHGGVGNVLSANLEVIAQVRS